MNTAALDTLIANLIPQLHEGDIIFSAIDSFLYRQVAQGTGSWTSHVGIIVRENGQWIVLESAVPTVRRSSLRDFVSRSCNGQISVRRLHQPLTAEQVQRLKNIADNRMGQFYHLGFKFDSKRQFCSKFVYLTFKEALGIELGRLQTLKELIIENPQASLRFWRCWYLGFIPWQRRTVTPASQLIDPQLHTVFSTVSDSVPL